METKRETLEIITPIENHKVVLNAYIIEKELKEIERIWQDYSITMEMEIEKEGGKDDKSVDKGKVTQKSKSYNLADKMESAENKALELLVVSVNGKTENILEALGNMRPKDFASVKKEIDKITKDEDFLDPSENTNAEG